MKLPAFVFVLVLGFAPHVFAQTKPVANDPAFDAGYKWAEDNDIQSSDQCGGNSKSFIEGCKAWAEDDDATNKDAAESDDDRQD